MIRSTSREALIRRPSVTPTDAGALDVLEDGARSRLGFVCHRLPFSEPGTPDVDNLYARLSAPAAPNFCFAGHTDVVPPGDATATGPVRIRSRRKSATAILYGRGAADMKMRRRRLRVAAGQRRRGMGAIASRAPSAC